MNERNRAVIARLHDTPTMAVLVASGAGSSALAWLLAVPGATRTLLEATVPYGWQATVNYLGWQPRQYASPGTAASLAAAAYSRARLLRPADNPIIGVSCTASIASDYDKRGAHRAYVGLWDGLTATTYSLELRKGLRDRPAEETVVSELVLRAIADGAGLDETIPINLLSGEEVIVKPQAIDHPLEHLFERTATHLTYYGPDAIVPDEPISGAILPGSFNPLHDGHRRLARAAEKRLGQPIIYELSVHNVDKPSLTLEQIEARLTPFSYSNRRIVLTREPLYRDKARLFPGSTFIIGYDTAIRLVNPVYYDGDPTLMQGALAEIQETQCNFLVAGRLVDGIYHTLDDIPVPSQYAVMFDSIPEADFRLDLSSSEMRQRGA